MVAVIKTSTSIRRALHYNEQKVKEENATLLHAEGFAKDTNELRFTDKLRHFEKLTELNTRTKVNSVHISLNFDVAEQLDPETLKQIAEVYLKKIGFEEQPYLVYEHHDAGHPHIHLVTTNIRSDGSRIPLHNIGRNQSEKARLEIEQQLKLVKAQRQQLKQVYTIKPVNAQRVQYGKSATKRAMTNVLDTVLPHYKYTSLPELNAVLKQYNMMADRGSKESRVYKNNGLVYRVLNEQGEKVGVPIKASDFYNKPTLAFLEKQFIKNKELREPFKKRVKNAIDFSVLKKPNGGLQGLAKQLQAEGIQLVVRQNERGVVYGLTYVDHKSKCVFNGSDLGKAYSASGLLNRLKQQPQEKIGQLLKQTKVENISQKQQEPSVKTLHTHQHQPAIALQGNEKLPMQHAIAQDILGPEKEEGLNPMLKQDGKKKRKKLHH